MREIKFRVWHKAYASMGQPHDGHMDYNPKFLKTMTSTKEIENFEMDTIENFCSVSINEVFTNAIPIMQYTGKKDKNGKEIYEDDIVTNGPFKQVIEFKFGKWIMVDKENDYRTVYLYDAIEDTLGEIIEVIGNVHENPELVEERGISGSRGIIDFGRNVSQKELTCFKEFWEGEHQQDIYERN